MEKKHIALMIRKSISKNGGKPAMSYKEKKEWKSISYEELGKRVNAVAKALIETGIETGDMVGIFSQNRPEWAIADFASLTACAVSVPVYATNTAKQTEYIVNDAELKLLFVGDADQYKKVKSFLPGTPQLKTIVVFNRDVPIEGGESVYLEDFLKKGEASAKDDVISARLEKASTDDIATLIYTSGTTGDPKGVMLTHANFYSQFDALDVNFNIGTADKSLCFLPLSHAYERTWSYYIFRQGANNNYVSDPKRVVEFLGEVRPTAMVSVPRLYEKIYSTVFDRLEKAPGSKKKLFGWALEEREEIPVPEEREKAGRPVAGADSRAGR